MREETTVKTKTDAIETLAAALKGVLDSYCFRNGPPYRVPLKFEPDGSWKVWSTDSADEAFSMIVAAVVEAASHDRGECLAWERLVDLNNEANRLPLATPDALRDADDAIRKAAKMWE